MLPNGIHFSWLILLENPLSVELLFTSRAAPAVSGLQREPRSKSGFDVIDLPSLLPHQPTGRRLLWPQLPTAPLSASMTSMYIPTYLRQSCSTSQRTAIINRRRRRRTMLKSRMGKHLGAQMWVSLTEALLGRYFAGAPPPLLSGGIAPANRALTVASSRQQHRACANTNELLDRDGGTCSLCFNYFRKTDQIETQTVYGVAFDGCGRAFSSAHVTVSYCKLSQLDQ